MIPLKDDNPTSTVPFVTFGIIAVNIIVFLYMIVLPADEGKRFILQYSVTPGKLFGGGAALRPGGYYTLFTSMFMHGGFLHIAGNMLYLWVFGDNIEDMLGHAWYLVFYLACGVAAAMAHGLANPASALPMLGASGAVAGVLGAYMVLFPKARVWTFFFFLVFWQVIPVPAIFIIGLWIVIQVISGMTASGQATGGVAWMAHVGGFVAGVFLVTVMKKRY